MLILSYFNLKRLEYIAHIQVTPIPRQSQEVRNFQPIHIPLHQFSNDLMPGNGEIPLRGGYGCIGEGFKTKMFQNLIEIVKLGEILLFKEYLIRVG